MAGQNESKPQTCWECDFFIQADEETTKGKCVRHAPTKADQLYGETISSTIDGLSSFANVIKAEETSCGEFKPSTVTVPDIPA